MAIQRLVNAYNLDTVLSRVPCMLQVEGGSDQAEKEHQEPSIFFHIAFDLDPLLPHQHAPHTATQVYAFSFYNLFSGQLFLVGESFDDFLRHPLSFSFFSGTSKPPHNLA